MILRNTRRRPARRTAFAVLGALVLTITLAGCGSSDDGASSQGGDPIAALTAAKKKFDEASSVHFTMATTSKPAKGTDAVLGAKGTLTHQPAFQGEVKALYIGITADIPLIAVDGKVYAKLPFSTGYAVINPKEYSAPDPATFADPAAGISGLLLKLEDAKKTGEKRDGKLVVTTYAGTLPGALVAPIIPSADAAGTYRTVVGIDDDGRIATLAVTGDFFSGGGDVTYDLAFDDYGKNVTISAP
ncbi:LppX_LprAFG lipoprotein [Nocardioides marmoriginsengisoli]|uniref:LppX_LprAFG lipoprotein n=1 Tax=Nocardioides marmoriginsengisoli TaxID=661483 RepID=A0A3N0CN46_9ACTN|nr:LppX_LprAFG lipoprotein [Nocardioides marmoriginsengisoli]RNL64882.1 LppX_LprAFG lipoprotein [Nocardioides marmoriginsengisoli]